MQRVHTRIRTRRPSRHNPCRFRLGLNVRLVRDAFRCQRPEALCRMFRPNIVPLPQRSHRADIECRPSTNTLPRFFGAR